MTKQESNIKIKHTYCIVKVNHYIRKKWFKQYIHTIKSSVAIGRAQYIGNGNGPLLPIEL